MISVLNHGLVRLVSYMQPNPAYAKDGWTGDLEVVRNARVSYDADWRTGDDGEADTKLLNYLVKNYHTSPLEAMVFTFEVKAPIFVFRQWHRHRTWSYSEQSARYSVLPEEYYIPEVSQITMQSKSNKQQRTDEINPNAELLQRMVSAQCESAFHTYHQMLALGMPRELARGVLPVNTFSHMFATVDFHNLTHFFGLRIHDHAQYEIRVYAEAMLELIEPVLPVLVKCIRQYRLQSIAQK